MARNILPMSAASMASWSCAASSFALTLIAALVLLAPPAQAGHLYVNSALGNDSNPGTSPELAFKHIGKALQVGGTKNDAIHIAAGEYSAATGEAFPLIIAATRQISGAGSGLTHIVGGAGDTLLVAAAPAQPLGIIDIDGLTLIGGRTGLSVTSPAGIYQVTLQDVVIADMSENGIEAHASPAGAAGSQVNLGFYWGRISGCQRGVNFQVTSPTLKSVLVVGQSRLEANAIGVDVECAGDVMATVSTSRIADHALVGLRAVANGGSVLFNVSSSLVARNGLGIEAGGVGGVTKVDVRSCTIADNGTGLTTATLRTPPLTTSIANSILWNNDDDVALAGPVSAQFNDVSDADFAGASGNVSVDPLFRDERAGDYRLSWGSPLIETGAAIPANDLDGNARPTDGNLDIVAVNDVGALEFVPLDMISPALNGQIPELPLGGTLRLEAWGPAGATAALFVSPSKPIPISTAFGFLSLDPAFFFPLGSLAAGPASPGVFEVVIPDAPALVGLIPVLQTLTTSTLAPKGKALSNMVTFSIVP